MYDRVNYLAKFGILNLFVFPTKQVRASRDKDTNFVHYSPQMFFHCLMAREKHF